MRYKIGVRFDPEQLGACDEDVSKFMLTPRYAAWASQRACDDDIPYWNVSIRRIKAGSRTQTYPAGAGCEINCPGGYAKRSVGPVQRIALTPQGALAWSARDQAERRFFEISKITDGQPVRLARGTDILISTPGRCDGTEALSHGARRGQPALGNGLSARAPLENARARGAVSLDSPAQRSYPAALDT